MLMTIYDLIQQWKDKPEQLQKQACVDTVYTIDCVWNVLSNLDGERSLPDDVAMKCLQGALDICNDIMDDRGASHVFYDELERLVQDALDDIENDM